MHPDPGPDQFGLQGAVPRVRQAAAGVQVRSASGGSWTSVLRSRPDRCVRPCPAPPARWPRLPPLPLPLPLLLEPDAFLFSLLRPNLAFARVARAGRSRPLSASSSFSRSACRAASSFSRAVSRRRPATERGALSTPAAFRRASRRATSLSSLRAFRALRLR